MEIISPVSHLRNRIAAMAPFSPALGGGHTQTLLGHILPSLSQRKFPLFETHVVPLADGDKIIGHSGPGAQVGKGWLHIFHGLSGDVDSVYMPRAATAAALSGFNTVLWNHRGCGAGRGLAMEPYHSGRSDDIARIVAWAKQKWPDVPHGVLGFSLSANAACLLAAGIVPSLKTSPLTEEEWRELGGTLPDFAIAINPPFSLALASQRLSRESSRLYGSRFVFDLLQLLDDRIAMTPISERQQKLKIIATDARRQLNVLSTVEHFDAFYTARAGGFYDRHDYYSKASSGRYLDQIALPLIILSADDDPITHGFSDLSSTVAVSSKWVLMDRQPSGGHMGYVDRNTLVEWLRAAFSRQNQHPPTWFERRLAMYLEQL